ncbi:hypothetical protein [Atopobium fossor]|uniref:hypothetical protein n=1 Tax=Atopobium fossor TaxID=39487 RepID=UPI00040870F4|nr:hypothetical protein [Atopobium fossor]
MSSQTSRHMATASDSSSKNSKAQDSFVDGSTSKSPTPRRDQKKIPLAIKIGASLIALVILGSAGYLIWRHLTGAAQAKEQIAAAISSVSKSDAAIVPLNNTISSDLGVKTSEELTKIRDDAKKSTSSLDEAQAHVNNAKSLNEFMTDDERTVVQALQDSIDQRRKLIDAGSEVLTVDIGVLDAKTFLTQAMEKAVSADSHVEKSVEAAAEYAKSLAKEESSVDDANIPIGFDKSAMEDITAAQGFENNAEQAFSQTDYSVYTNYLTARKDAIQALLDADTHIAFGEFDKAQASIEDYNKREAAVADLAKQLPETPDAFLSEPYDSALKKSLDAYKEIAEKLAVTDEKVRNYQGLAAGGSKKA